MSEPNTSPSPQEPGNSADPVAAGASTPSAQPPTPPIEPAPPSKPRKRRRWRWAAAIVVVLILLAAGSIALAPTLLSMGWARAIVLGQINKDINGQVEIADYTVSWSHGLKASGIRVFDTEHVQIAEVASASTHLSLLDALRGRFNFGQTTIAGVGFTLKQYADGSTNFDRLLKRSPPTPAAPPAASAGPSQPKKLPPVSIHLQLTGWHGTVEREGAAAGKSQVIDFDAIDADVNITDINAPIDHSLKIVARVDNGQSQGTFTEKGTVALIQNNQVEPGAASVKESISLGNFDLASAVPFLPASVRQLAGVANGNIDIDVDNGKSGTVAAIDGRLGIDRGSLSFAGSSGSDQGTAHVRSASSAPVQILSDYSLAAAIRGKFSSDNGTTRLTFSDLSVADGPHWLNIAKAADAPLEVVVRPDGTASAQGSVKVAMDMAPFYDIAAKLAATPPEVSGQASGPLKLTRGRLEGTFALANPRADAIGLSAVLDASGLTVTGEGPGIHDESLRIVLRASAPSDFGQLTVNQCDVTGSVVNAHVPNAVIRLKTGTGKDARIVPALQMLRELSAAVDVPDAGKLQTMLDALLPAPAVQPPSAAAPPPVRARFTAGSLAFRLDATTNDNQLTFVPDIQGKGLAFAAGAVKYPLGDIALKAKAIVIADAAPTDHGLDGQSEPVLQQIHQLLIPELLATGAGCTIALAGRPIVIQDPAYLSGTLASTADDAGSKPAPVPSGKSPSIDAAISIAGDLPTLTNLLDALVGRAPAPSYLGTYSLQQTFATRNGIINTSGNGAMQDFAVLGADHKTPTFTEKNIVVESNVSVDATHGPAVLSIGKLHFAMESSKALDVSITGAIRDLAGQRIMDHVIADITYDGEKLTPILRSFLPPTPTPADPHPVDRFKDLAMSGRKTERFAIWGNFPANQPFNQAIASLSASGALAVDSLDVVGLNIQNLQLPVSLDHGVAKLAYAPNVPAAAPPSTGPAGALATTAACNGGTIDLTGVTLDLTAPSALLTIPPEKKVLYNVALNKVLAATFNSYLPVFDDTDATAGTLTFIVHRCDRLPTEELTAATSASSAVMDFTVSFTSVQLGGPIVGAIESFGAKDVRANMRGDITDARFQLGAGRLTIQNFNLLVGKDKVPAFALAGKVGLSPEGRLNLLASIRPELLAKLIPDKKLLAYFPDKLDFPITGTKSVPRLALDKSFKKALGEAGKKALLKGFGSGDLLPNLGRKAEPGPTTAP